MRRRDLLLGAGGDIKGRLEREAFDPGPLGVLVNPFYLARRALARTIRELAPRMRGELLDVGCGIKPYEQFFTVDRYVGLELDRARHRESRRADFFYDGRRFPFADASFDCLVCNQVLEHVFEPAAFLAECRRVLRPNGRMLLSVPFAWDEHEQPYDYARYSSYGLKYLVEQHGFSVERSIKTAANATVLFQLANAYLYKTTVNWPGLIRYFVVLVLMAPINLLGLLATLSPRNEDLYLDNVLLLQKKA